MDQKTMREILSGERRGPGPGALRALLWAASLPYAGAMRLRRWAYRRGILRSRAAAVPVISVGNLTTGGTGKTPTAAWLVQRLKEAARRPAVLLRGYKAAEGRSDEAGLLESLCGVPVVVNPDRVAGAAAAVEAGADVLVMDDGYQHRRLRRDLDVVLIDATSPFGYGWCLPRGLLREAPSALKDAHVVLITHSDEVPAGRLAALRERVRRLAPRALIALAVHKPVCLIDEGGRPKQLDALAGRDVFAFCGLGRPEGFFAMLGDLRARLVGRRALNDHVEYTEQVRSGLAREIRHSQADLAVTTGKDSVKLAGTELGGSVWQLVIEIDVVNRKRELVDRIRAAAGQGPS